MSRIFISYKRVDKEKVFKIKKQIESALGERCWIDLDGIESDAQFKNVIIRAINKSEVVLFMYSKAHSEIVDFEKDWTLRELNFASKKNKRIVFVNLDGSPLTDTFEFDYGAKQQIDGLSPQSLSRLNEDLKRWLGIKEPIAPPPHQGSNTSTELPQETGKRRFFLTHNKKGCKFTGFVLVLFCGVFFLTIALRYFNNQATQPPSEGITAIDLALPSGTLWANMNVGANSETDFGNLYAWGETNVKTNYDQIMYKQIHLTNIAGTENDVATQTLGAGWQMPSTDDFNELLQYCTWKWSKKSGTYGYVFTGRNGKSIFLPASGCIYSKTVENRNKYCYYWTSNKVNDKFGHGLLFYEGELTVGNGYLYFGRSVRGVRKSK